LRNLPKAHRAELRALRALGGAINRKRRPEELARLGRVSRARITQIMGLLMLAPEIQEEVLFGLQPQEQPVGGADMRGGFWDA